MSDKLLHAASIHEATPEAATVDGNARLASHVLIRYAEVLALDRAVMDHAVRNDQLKQELAASCEQGTQRIREIQRLTEIAEAYRLQNGQTANLAAQLRIELEDAKKAIAARERRIHELLTSRSWRVTAPLRKLKSFF